LGHVSQSCHMDTWMNQLMGFLRMAWPYDQLKVDHPKSSIKGDWAKDSRNTYEVDYDSEYTVHSLDAKWKATEDARSILYYLTELEKETLWFEIPNVPGWWYWDRCGGAEGNVLLMDMDGKTFTLSKDMKEGGRLDVLNEVEVKQGLCCLINAF
jgi:hypothetical protein